MIGHRIALKGLSTPGWTNERGRVIGKKEDGDGQRFLVRQDNWRKGWHSPT